MTTPLTARDALQPFDNGGFGNSQSCDGFVTLDEMIYYGALLFQDKNPNVRFDGSQAFSEAYDEFERVLQSLDMSEKCAFINAFRIYNLDNLNLLRTQCFQEKLIG